MLRYLLTYGALFLIASFSAQANDIVKRNGLAPDQQSKVTKALARNRIVAESAADRLKTQKQTSNAGGAKECTTSIGNVDLSNQRAGTRAPKDNIVVIQAPIVNGC